MDIDALSVADTDSSSKDKANDRLNTLVAITVAILATFMGVCKVKDDNIVQAMQQAQTEKVDQWAFYQARNLREQLAESTVDTMKLATGTPAAAEAIARYTELGQREASKKGEAQQKAQDAEKTYDALNRHDDQFDLSDASLDISISLLALTALTRKRWLYFVALVPTIFGIVMGLSGLLGWDLHPDLLASLLS